MIKFYNLKYLGNWNWKRIWMCVQSFYLERANMWIKYHVWIQDFARVFTSTNIYLPYLFDNVTIYFHKVTIYQTIHLSKYLSMCRLDKNQTSVYLPICLSVNFLSIYLGCKIQMASDSGGQPVRMCTLTGSPEAISQVKKFNIYYILIDRYHNM